MKKGIVYEDKQNGDKKKKIQFIKIGYVSL